MEIRICCPSYHRDIVKSFDFFGDLLKVYVCETEYDNYIKHNPKFKDNFIKMKKGVQGNVSRVRNYILDDCFKNGCDVCCIVDDDMSYIGYYEDKTIHKLEKEDILPFIAKYSLLCKEFGFYLWGVNLNSDKQCYREYSPFSTTSCILGPFSCHLAGGDVRYDEGLPLKEDYDLAIAHLNKHRGILRVNKYHYVCEQSTNKGGCATYRNIEREKEQLGKLQQKWGKDIVKLDSNDRSHNKVKRKVVDYNPVINVPIKGI